MFDQFHQKRIRHSFTFSSLLLAMATLLVCSFPAASNAETAPATAVAPEAPAASTPKAAPCKGLKPINNLDELLYQFHINLESDCLFEMPVEELEKIWGIKILDEELAKPKNYYPLSETEFYNKPYESDKDAFYVELVRNENNEDKFFINITKEYSEKYGTLFPDEQWPDLLPEPMASKYYYNLSQPCEFPNFLKDIPKEQKKKCYYSLWQSSDKYRKIKLSNSRQIVFTNDYDRRRKGNPDIAKKFDTPKTEAIVTEKAASCRGLKPFNNLDELLYQFYINLDSDCLFKMPLAELEEVWGIKIGTDREKPYKSEKDAFYVSIVNNFYTGKKEFQIRITNAYYDQHVTLFPEGNFPKLLPRPLKKPFDSNDVVDCGNSLPKDYGWGLVVLRTPSPRPKKIGVYGNEYCWLNSNHTRVLIIENYPCSGAGVTEIKVTEHVKPYYLDKEKD